MFKKDFNNKNYFCSDNNMFSLVLRWSMVFVFVVSGLFPFVSFAGSHSESGGLADMVSSSAERSGDEVRFCPIKTFPQVFISDFEKNDNSIVGNLTINNDSNYVFGSLKVAVVVFNPDDKKTLFWSVLPGDYQLLAGEQRKVDFSLNLSYLPAGEYAVYAYLSQSNNVNLLGSVVKAVRELSDYATEDYDFVFVKNSPAVKGLKIDLKLDDNESVVDSVYKYDNEKDSLIANFTVETQKETLRGLDLLNVITKGDVPLGEAVVAKNNNNFSLLPGVVFNYQLSAYDTMFGDYSIFSAFIDGEELQPIYSWQVIFDKSVKQTLAYFPFVAVSNMPFSNEDFVVTCVNYLSDDSNSELISGSGFISPLAAKFTLFDLQSEKKNIAERLVSSLDSEKINYLSFRPNLESKKEIIGVDMLAYSLVPKSGLDNYVSIDSYSRKPFVLNQGQRIGKIPIDDNISVSNTWVKSPYYYIGIILVSLSLLIIVLRRLDTGPGFKTEVSDDELR